LDNNNIGKIVKIFRINNQLMLKVNILKKKKDNLKILEFSDSLTSKNFMDINFDNVKLVYYMVKSNNNWCLLNKFYIN